MTAALAGIFLLSGAAALIYQVVWLRMLSLVFGVTVYAASAVLTSFMAGLALGSWLGGRRADRFSRPLRVFAFVEIGIALGALAIPFVLEAIAALYIRLQAAMPDALPLLTFARLACSAMVLLVPTALMGMSLPILARHATRSGGMAAARIAWLYAANTAGGIAGTVGAGFVLIGGIGLAATTWLAAALNGTAALAALLIDAFPSRALATAPAATVEPAAPARDPRAGRRILWLVFGAGFAGLALEVVWFRLLGLFLTATTYAFTTMLATVLLGIAVGSAIAARGVRRSADPIRSVVRIQIWTGVAVVLSMTALAYTYRLGWRTSGMIQACVVAMLPATTLMGATFPFAVAIRLGGARLDVGRALGGLYAVNVLGAVAGSLAGGFVFLPWLGSRASLVALAAFYVAAGLIFAAAAGLDRRRLFASTGAGVAAFLAAAATLPDVYAFVADRRYARERLIYRAEGVQTTAAVHLQPSGRRVLYLDGLHQANDSEDMVRVHAEIGHLPMVLHPAPARALVVGVGGGVTAGAVARHADTAVDVVELAASVVSAVPFFAHVNGGLLERPNVRLRIDDGRNFLRLAPRRYDVITADLIQPIHAGAGNLYSVEYFRLARQALAPGGLMMQWIGHREDAHYRLIMRTFLAAFPHATTWANGTLMIGSTAPLRLSRTAYDAKPLTAELRAALDLVGLSTFDALLARYTAGPDEMTRFAGSGPILTDDRPLLEFHRSLGAGSTAVDVSSLRGDVSRHLERR